MKWLWAVGGAILAPLLLRALFHSPGSLAGSAMLLAVILGAVSGLVIAVAGERGKENLPHKIGVAVALLVLVPLIYAALLPFLPPPPPSPFQPANANAREAWANTRDTLDDGQGLALAMSLEQCIRNTSATSARLIASGQCSPLRRNWYGAGPDSVAAQGGYAPGDDGWRWDVVGGSPLGALVFPDPIFVSQPGPVFDVRSRRILRRANRDAPGYFTSSILATLAKSVACIERRAAQLKRDGVWDGRGTTLPLALPGAAEPGCASVRIEDRPSNEMAIWNLTLFGDGLPWDHRVGFRPVVPGRVTPYEIRFNENGVAFMVDDAGLWHMGAGTVANESDPAPPPCMMDPRLPCE